MIALITGAEGQVGWELCSALSPTTHVLGMTRRQMDLVDPKAIRAAIRDIKPDLIINAAAFTAVDKAQTEPTLAEAVNAQAVGVIGDEARRIGAAVIHYSTDYIFDGTKRTPYQPDDVPNPQSVYGRSKLHGEQAVRNTGASCVILRTAWVYGMRGRNFLLTMLRLANEKSELRIVNDQVGAPTWSRSIAQATAQIVIASLKRESGRTTFGGNEGTYHLTSAGSTSWHGFASRIFELADIPKKPILIPITTAEYAAPAARPAYSVLDCSKTRETFGVSLESWDTMLAQALVSQ